MGYAHKSSDGLSDVTVVDTGQALECRECHLHGEYEPEFYTDVSNFFEHLDQHQMAGDQVPWYTRPRIYRDWSNGEFASWDHTRVEQMLPYAQQFGQEGG